MVQLCKHGVHLFCGDLSHVLFSRVYGLRNGFRKIFRGKGLVPALVALVVMTLVTERGLSSTMRKPGIFVTRSAQAGVFVPAFMDSL
jgi:hypothetical protein